MPDHELEPRPRRLHHSTEVRLRAPDGSGTPIATDSHTINVSENGLLMEVPLVLDGVAGQEVTVEIHRAGDAPFTSLATIIRFESPFGADPARQAMALRLHSRLPATLLQSVPGTGS